MKHPVRSGFAVLLALPLLAACGNSQRLVGNDEYGSDSQRARVQGRLGGAGDGIVVFGVGANRGTRTVYRTRTIYRDRPARRGTVIDHE